MSENLPRCCQQTRKLRLGGKEFTRWAEFQLWGGGDFLAPNLEIQGSTYCGPGCVPSCPDSQDFSKESNRPGCALCPRPSLSLSQLLPIHSQQRPCQGPCTRSFPCGFILINEPACLTTAFLRCLELEKKKKSFPRLTRPSFFAHALVSIKTRPTCNRYTLIFGFS